MDYYSNVNQMQSSYSATYYDTNYYNNYIPSSFQSLDPRLKYYNDRYKNQEANIQNKNDDELWVETWLSKLGKIDINLDSTIVIKKVDLPKKSPVKSVLKINVAKNLFARMLKIIEKLQEAQEYLKTNVASLSSTEWKKHTVEIGTLKDELQSLLSQFENFDALQQLYYNVRRRKLKRLSQKKRKARSKENLRREKEEHKKVNEEIDRWLENMKDSVERVKMEEHMKKDADCVLAEVTKKKSEARKHLSLISALIKLREVREKIKSQRGEKISAEDHRAFSTTTEKLTAMWENALKVYIKEDEGLRLMLQLNATEDSNTVKLSKEKEWEEVLFGPKSVYTPLYWALTSAERDLETFVAIRKSWDTFLAQPYDEKGTKIPIGWVLPNPNPDENWLRYLHK